jgi:hypothetical protein
MTLDELAAVSDDEFRATTKSSAIRRVRANAIAQKRAHCTENIGG